MSRGSQKGPFGLTGNGGKLGGSVIASNLFDFVIMAAILRLRQRHRRRLHQRQRFRRRLRRRHCHLKRIKPPKGVLLIGRPDIYAKNFNSLIIGVNHFLW
jgi:hypothetical protein